ncbi:hypothetical protein [Chryseobacterium sp. ISL-6]|uniref:hypothetical protein n=1 Tax=Chryseobacterium sp. ISL-6 TaxID=2819143 RepID=UPI001BE726FC|nr:hypothetical protein [Chryseobacterium sp. ISL-6]MBT2623496.1 hypothetical protein [Chryseobacterium sp. ISL-6]
MKAKILISAMTVLAITACSQSKKNSQESKPQKKETTTGTKPLKNVGFDINSIPVSDKKLGDFPYISLPEGYDNVSDNPISDSDKAYFWVGDHFEQPVGKIFFSRIKAKDGKTYSETELLKGIQEKIISLGGKKINESKVTSDISATDEANKVKYVSGYGFIGYATTYTYLIRNADKNVWIQITPTDDGASVGWIILEAKS